MSICLCSALPPRSAFGFKQHPQCYWQLKVIVAEVAECAHIFDELLFT